MPTDAKYTIGATAVLVGKPGAALPTTTIRNWTREYAPHLSPDANPPTGTERRYTERDVAVLRLVHEWREQRIGTAEIHNRLQDATIPIVEVAAVDESTESPPEAATIAPEPLQLPAPVLNDIVGRLQGLESIDRRVARLEQRRNLVLVAVVAAAGGALVVAVIVWLVWLIMVR